MPGAAHRVADDQSLGQRAVIVGALRANGVKHAARARDQHRLVADAAGQHLALADVSGRDAFGEVGSIVLLFVAHRRLLMGRLLMAHSRNAWTWPRINRARRRSRDYSLRPKFGSEIQYRYILSAVAAARCLDC